jgi:hypothetical protein
MDSVLLLGDRELGTLRQRSVDGYWSYGLFTREPAFSEVATLFERLELAWEGDARTDGSTRDGRDDPLEVQEMVNALGLTVRTASGATQRVRDFKIIRGKYEYKLDV